MEIHFAPMLYVPMGTFDLSFYERAFNAAMTQSWKNDDGSIHVAEFSIGDAIFHVHEANKPTIQFPPSQIRGISVMIGLFVDDVQAVMKQAIQAGAKEIMPVTDFEYRYRQGELEDPFGHRWTIQKKI